MFCIVRDSIFHTIFIVIEHYVEAVFLREHRPVFGGNEPNLVDVEHIGKSASSHFFEDYKLRFFHGFWLNA